MVGIPLSKKDGLYIEAAFNEFYEIVKSLPSILDDRKSLTHWSLVDGVQV